MQWLRVWRPAMACRFEVTLPERALRDIQAARDALNEADHIESALSVFRETSQLSNVNRRAASGAVAAGSELFALLARCRSLYESTEGAFDITATPLSRCWGFLNRQGRVPDEADLARARSHVGMPQVILDEAAQTVRFAHAGVELNLGAVGKGYALDRLASVLRGRGVPRALLSAGSSSVIAIDGGRAGWTIDLRSPRRAGRIARLHLRDCAVGTSGSGEQFVMSGDARFGHVIDPRTGWPASGILSATVVTERAETADALSTAFLIGGLDLAYRYCQRHSNTLALITPEDTPDKTFVVGRCRGVQLEN